MFKAPVWKTSVKISLSAYIRLCCVSFVCELMLQTENGNTNESYICEAERELFRQIEQNINTEIISVPNVSGINYQVVLITSTSHLG